MYSQERSEFIEKFKKEHKIDTLQISRSRENNSQASLQTNSRQNMNQSMNISKGNSQIRMLKNKESTGNNRWDYLHQLEKVRQAKITSKKMKQKEEMDLKIQDECPFRPIFYSQKSKSKNKYEATRSNIPTTTNMSKEESAKDDFISCDVNQRTLMWTRKKEVKAENIKQQIIEKEVEECFFRPKIVRK